MKRLSHSIKYAVQGVLFLLTTQRNARFHFISACIVIGLGFWLKISTNEWTILSLYIAGVIGAESFNTAIETLCDALHPEYHPKIKIVKDLSAAAVLIISIGSLIGGTIIFLPKLALKFGIVF